jgi:hypothetical protein
VSGRQESLPRLGQDDRPPVAVQQPYAEFGLERPDPAAQCGLTEVQAGSGAPEVQLLGDSDEALD